MIPEAKTSAVAHALQCTFGVSEYEDISPMTLGLSSALIFRIVVREKPYLLRVITSTEPTSDPAHWYDRMKSAAEAGLAPHVWYANTDERISITDFVEAKTFELCEARARMSDVLKRLHSLPPFPFRMDYLDTMDGIVQKFRAAKILPESIDEKLFDQYEKVKKVYPRNAEDMVSCHNDLKPENILFDGDRVWLVDWEAAFLNDRYLDLSIVANFIVTNENEEKEYLENYFGVEVTEYHYARFFLMQQLLHLFYFTFFMLIYSRAGEPIDLNLARLGFRELHDRMWAGKIDLANNDARQRYALVHLDQLLYNLKQKRFADSLQIVESCLWP